MRVSSLRAMSGCTHCHPLLHATRSAAAATRSGAGGRTSTRTCSGCSRMSRRMSPGRSTPSAGPPPTPSSPSTSGAVRCSLHARVSRAFPAAGGTLQRTVCARSLSQGKAQVTAGRTCAHRLHRGRSGAAVGAAGEHASYAPLEVYFRPALELQKHFGVKHVFVSTDGKGVIEEAHPKPLHTKPQIQLTNPKP